jgi:C-terminal processing protease CtpA/Prc
VAVLTLDTMARDLDDFEEFLHPTFASLAHDPPTALLIDLRRNGGGDSRLGDELLEYLSDRPWRQAARKEWKVSAPLKRHLKSLLRPWIRWIPLQYLHPVGRQVWNASEGDIIRIEEERVRPREESLRYRGPLAWLIGPNTFSSAVGLAAGAEDCRRGMLVGAETGGVVNGFGEVIPFRLPHTQLGAQISTAFFVRADGDRSVRGGVRPDLAVRPEPGQAGDPVLEASVRALTSTGSGP